MKNLILLSCLLLVCSMMACQRSKKEPEHKWFADMSAGDAFYKAYNVLKGDNWEVDQMNQESLRIVTKWKSISQTDLEEWSVRTMDSQRYLNGRYRMVIQIEPSESQSQIDIQTDFEGEYITKGNPGRPDVVTQWLPQQSKRMVEQDFYSRLSS